jgi:predicted DNA-binding transcriptional regulator AlpA
MEPNERLDDDVTAEQIGITRGTLANWRSRHLGPPYLKIGRRVQYRQEDIDAWFAAQLKDPGSQSREAQA